MNINIFSESIDILFKIRIAFQFDSGGPVLWQNPTTGRIVSVGIIDYGIGCGTATPSVNTRVGAYMNWITSVTPGIHQIIK